MEDRVANGESGGGQGDRWVNQVEQTDQGNGAETGGNQRNSRGTVTECGDLVVVVPQDQSSHKEDLPRGEIKQVVAGNRPGQGGVFREAGVLVYRDHLVHIRVSIQHLRGPAVYERIDAGVRISEPEGTEERGRQENVPDMACGNQEDALSREFHREIKVSD